MKKREKRKLKRSLKRLIIDFLGQKPTLSQILELFTATDDYDLKKYTWRAIGKHKPESPDDLVVFLNKVRKDYRARYWAKIVSLDPPADLFLSIMKVCPDYQDMAFDEFLKLAMENKKKKEGLSRWRTKSLLRVMLSIPNVASRAWAIYKKMDLCAEEFREVVSDTAIPPLIRKEAEGMLEIKRIPDFRTTKILVVYRKILETCQEIEALEDERKKK